jgi:methyl coenzyme M reductase subunit C-like uncharacterized protein (methanogenesis marker protein 7)
MNREVIDLCNAIDSISKKVAEKLRSKGIDPLAVLPLRITKETAYKINIVEIMGQWSVLTRKHPDIAEIKTIAQLFGKLLEIV